MTLADLPVLNPSSPGREAKRGVVVAALFAIFGVLYALERAAILAPPDLSGSTDPVFGFAFPRGWGIIPAVWSGASTWPGRIAAAHAESTLAVMAVIVLAIALVIIMHPDILSRQGPQYVSPARRITTVVIAFVLAFIIYVGVARIEQIFSSTLAVDPDKARRHLVGYAAISVLLFGGIWSFIGPKDFGRRIPLRISHGALGGLAVWGAITFATLLSSQPRAFLSSSLDTFYSLLTTDAAGGSPGATAGWAMSTDILTAAVAMAVAGVMLVVTAPQSLGPGNRRGSATLGAVLGAFLALVALTTYSVTKTRANTINFSTVDALQLDRTAPARVVIQLSGVRRTTGPVRVASMATTPSATADDCLHQSGDERSLPAATNHNIQVLTAWLESHGNEVSGAAIRVASCRIALLALRWDPVAARDGIFMSQHPERIGALTYYVAAPNVAAARPADLTRLLHALSDTTHFIHGRDAATRFADLARVAGDTALESSWRQRIIQPSVSGTLASLLARPAYTDGTIGGKVQSDKSGWRIGLISAPDPSSGTDPDLNTPRAETQVLSSMVAAQDVGADGRFSFTGLRDGYYQLALLAPEGTKPPGMIHLTLRGDPGVIRLDPTHKAKDVGAIAVTY
ncbi:MAG TPA: hypothetical protein VGI92_12945 [Gemmatimonadales bacterium]|jgi:hypothetical protein